MHAPTETAFVAAAQALLAMSMRQVHALEREDPSVSAVMVECDGESVTVTLMDTEGRPVGGYTL